MRFASQIVAAVVGWSVVAAAAPAQEAELKQLEQELEQQRRLPLPYAAVKTARKLYALRQKASGKDAPVTALAEQTLASLLMETGDHVEAEKLFHEVVIATERLRGPESREVWMALQQVDGVYRVQGRLDELDPVHQRLLAITKKLDGEHSKAYADELDRYGMLYFSRGEYSSAQRTFEQSLQLREALAPSKQDPALLRPIKTLALMSMQANQKPKAIALFDRAIAISEQADVMARGATLWEIALQYRYFGRDDLAQPLTKRVIELYDQEVARLDKVKPDDPAISSLLGQIGDMYRMRGDLVAAEQAFTRSVALDDKRGANGRGNTLAEIKRALGKPREALAVLEKAQAVLAKISASSATAYDPTIADVLRELGEYRRAEALFVAHRALLEQTYGKHNRLDGAVQLGLANLYMASGNLPRAEQMLAGSLDTAERELSQVLRTGTESDHATYFATNSYQLDAAISYQLKYAPNSASAGRLGLTTLLRRKGRVLDAAAASLATIRSRLSPADQQLLDDLATARAKLAKLTLGGGTYAKEIAALEDQIHQLELAVGRKSVAYRVVTQPVELAAVQKAIPRGARLVELASFQPIDPTGPYRIDPVLPPRRFAAYVVGTTGDPVLVDLGPVGPIDQAVEQLRKAVADPDNDRAAELGRALYDLTLAKLIPALGGATSILIAPDGTLNVVPFSALVDDKGQFLIKRFTFTYLTSGRDLLRLDARTKARGGGVIFADPSFDATGTPPAAGVPTRGRRSVDLASLSWPPLPGTGQEADAIEHTMRGYQVHRGAAATEAALKAVHGPKVLHLATHGFFLPDAASETHENPLLRSGLALAGANKLASGDDDGILTAMEASGLDLRGTDLVVLSACETGVGKVTNGDGVYGLRRALVIAGAESLVMSLWQVDDAATKELMTGYYTRLRAGKPRSSALREVQLELAARARYAHPFYWASFLPAGTDVPLAR